MFFKPFSQMPSCGSWAAVSISKDLNLGWGLACLHRQPVGSSGSVQMHDIFLGSTSWFFSPIILQDLLRLKCLAASKLGGDGTLQEAVFVQLNKPARFKDTNPFCLCHQVMTVWMPNRKWHESQISAQSLTFKDQLINGLIEFKRQSINLINSIFFPFAPFYSCCILSSTYNLDMIHQRKNANTFNCSPGLNI